MEGRKLVIIIPWNSVCSLMRLVLTHDCGLIESYAQSNGIDARSDRTAETELGVAGRQVYSRLDVDNREKDDYQSVG
jgi:hypothetical protein